MRQEDIAVPAWAILYEIWSDSSAFTESGPQFPDQEAEQMPLCHYVLPQFDASDSVHYAQTIDLQVTQQ
jgi:hypothetical protein